MKVRALKIPGCYELRPQVLRDERGYFVKTFHEDMFSDHHLPVRFAEEYYSLSQKNVLRGLHFQLPPHDHAKMVYCVSGQVLDAILDLRIGSPTYGEHELVHLNAEEANALVLSSGVAHGFYVLSDQAILMYKVTTIYAPEHDSGLRWDSAGIPWPSKAPVISRRDAGFARFADFKSPFTYQSGDAHGAR